MKMKLAEVKNRHQALCMLGNKKLPVKLSYAISKNIMKLQEELEVIEKTRIKLVEQYAEKDEDGNCKITEDGKYNVGENEQKLNDEFVEFLNSDVDMDIQLVSESIVESLEDARYDALTPAELISIDFMMEHLQEIFLEKSEVTT